MSIFGKKSDEGAETSSSEAPEAEKTQPVDKALENPATKNEVEQVIASLMSKKELDPKEGSKQIDPNKTADPTEIPSDKKEGSEQIQQ